MKPGFFLKKIIKLESKIEPSLTGIKKGNQTVVAMAEFCNSFFLVLSRYRAVAGVFKLTDESYLKAKKVGFFKPQIDLLVADDAAACLVAFSGLFSATYTR